MRYARLLFKSSAVPLFLALFLIACLVAAYLTRGAPSSGTPAKQPAKRNASSPVDQHFLQTAEQMQAAADTIEEQALAEEAWSLADNELDQAFSSALHAAEASSLPVSGPLKELADRVAGWKTQVAADQKRIAELTAKAAANAAASDQVELAKAQLTLDQDELEDAQLDLARQGGDPHAAIERELQEHEAAQHQAAPAPKAPPAGRTGTLSEHVRSWLALGDRQQQLAAARAQVLNHVSTLEKEHQTLEALADHKQPAQAAQSADSPADDDSAGEADTLAALTQLQHLSDQRKALSDTDKRIQDSQQLADVYSRWDAAVAARRTGVLHLMLQSLATVLVILLAMVLINRSVRHAFNRHADPRRLHQLRVMSTIAVQLVALIVIVLITFGPPSQISTIIGLTTAGLTVALKDFIVAFFGWFALMGKNGIRIGDWVEILGVGGEVVEIGVLKTVLLEMGNSGVTGHPTGRRVAFVNSFAIEGHYFNFSTAGQWLWDELQVSLPVTGDPYLLAQQIREIVERATEADGVEAQKDWERVTHQYGTRPFSAKPVAEIRPTPTGMDVIVRYITRAPQRYQVKSQLFEPIVDLLHKAAGGAGLESVRQSVSSN
jgi:small-conductance mechanosensitive channel